MTMADICVLGTGMAGYGAAYRLQQAGVRGILFDKKPHYGGHTASFGYEGKYTFDEGPHVSFTKHERLQKLFADADAWTTSRRRKPYAGRAQSGSGVSG